MLSHKITLISKVDPLKFLMTRPTLTGRLAKWAVLLLQFDITYIPQKAIKGQALADFLAAHPLPADSPLNDELPDKQIFSRYNDRSRSSTRKNRRRNFVLYMVILLGYPNLLSNLLFVNERGEVDYRTLPLLVNT